MQNLQLQKHSDKGILYVLTFLFTFHSTPVLYINSSFLGQYMSDSQVGLVFTASSIAAIIGLLATPLILRRIGNFKTFVVVAIFETLCLTGLALTGIPMAIVIIFTISTMLRRIAFFNIDIFLEHSSSDKETGGIRGLYLTSLSLATILGPIIASFIINDHNFSQLYLLSAVLMLPVLYIPIRYLNKFKDNHYHTTKILPTIKRIFRDKDLYAIIACSMLLQIFYAWMVIYTPLYLHEHIGFTLSQTTLIIAIALLPFILFDALWGKIADTKLGEKEMLTLGFVITAISTAAIAFIDTPAFITWTIILFMTRVGASLIETMVDTYVFKHIDDDDTDVLSMYRMTNPIAYIIGPLAASALFTIIDFNYIFLVLGAIMLYGITYSLSIRDTL